MFATCLCDPRLASGAAGVPSGTASEAVVGRTELVAVLRRLEVVTASCVELKVPFVLMKDGSVVSVEMARVED
jgi:hypothetical protein